MSLVRHVLEALHAYASQSRQGKGCAQLVCSAARICGPCHARVALEQMAKDKNADKAEQAMTTRALYPKGRWRILSKTSPSGKTMFVCLSCGGMATSPAAECVTRPVVLYNGAHRACKDWEPSPFEVQ